MKSATGLVDDGLMAGGSSREFLAMGETLTQQRRVKEEVIRYVNFCHRGRTVDIGNDIQVTVLYKKATANYVPAAAVIRRWRALSGIIGRKEGAGGTKGLW